MVKKSIRLLLVIITITISLSCISACNKTHEHTYKDGWVCDEEYHWRVATCGDIEIGLKGLHNFVDGVCTLCGYEDPNYVPPEKPGTDDPEIDDPGTNDPVDPELPDDDPGSAERPKPPSGDEPQNPDDPIDPGDDDDTSDDIYGDTFFYPENEYEWGNSTVVDGLKYTELSDEDGLVVGYAVSASEEKRNESEITIPAEYNDKPVIMVDKDGFKGCTSLRKVTLPNEMQIIGEGAFNGCTSLSSVTIPSTLWLICREAFVGCRSLTEIDLNKVREIRYAAFKECPLKKLVIPNTVHTIASGTFFNCGKLTEITIGTGLKSVGGQAFYNCGGVKVNISDLEAWCNIAFVYDNSNPLNSGGKLYLNNELVTNLIIPEGCGVNKYSFSGCSSIEKVTIPSTAGKIGEGAFTKCSALSDVKFKEGADEIDSFAFGYCYKLTEIILPDSIKILRTQAFYNCTNLKKVVLGKGITTMEYDVFPRFTDPPQFYYRGSESDWNKINKHSTWAPNAGKIIFNYED